MQAGLALGAKPRFIVLEGLSAVGKTTTAALVARRLGATLVKTQPPAFDDARIHVDRSRLVMARMHFWMACNYLASDTVREHLASGRDVVLESYFYRTIATHAAMGAEYLPPIDWVHAMKPDLGVLLTVDERDRRERLAERAFTRGPNYWSSLEELNVEVSRRIYASSGMTVLDATGLDPTAVAERLARLVDDIQSRRGYPDQSSCRADGAITDPR